MSKKNLRTVHIGENQDEWKYIIDRKNKTLGVNGEVRIYDPNRVMTRVNIQELYDINSEIRPATIKDYILDKILKVQKVK